MKKILYVLLSIFVISRVTTAQTFDLQFVVEKNGGVVSGDFDVRIQIKSNGSFFGMGTSNLVFSYNTAALSNPLLLSAHNFDGFIPPSTYYQTITTTQPFGDVVSVNIVLSSGVGTGQIVQSTWMDVATIHFEITDPTMTTMIAWRTITPNRTNVFDDHSVEITANSLSGINIVLPVDLPKTDEIPSEFYISQNYPNPFNPITQIDIGIPKNGEMDIVTLEIFNVLGKKVRTLFEGYFNPGIHQITWDGTNNTGKKMSGGIYFYYLKSKQFTRIKKMILMK
jgi:hypothetical protein